MNILYVTNLDGCMFRGPNYSVPKQIIAQSKYDNVLWYNVNTYEREDWRKLPFYKNLNDFPKQDVRLLPKPFSKPDLVIFEGMYKYLAIRMTYSVLMNNIPYAIIPRCELTEKAQIRKKMKKIIANKFFFYKFAQKAVFIQYLTKEEKKESGEKWNKKTIVIPNGISIKEKKSHFCANGIRGTYVGRLEMYHKGLDIMLEAIKENKDLLRCYDCSIELYGPDRNNTLNKLIELIAEYDIGDIVNINGPIFDVEKEKVLLETDFFIMTSRFEGHPMGLIEALSYGIPCLVTRGTNMYDEIAETKAGWAAENDVKDVSRKIRNMLLNSDNFEEISENAFLLAKRFNWDKIAKLSHELYLKNVNLKEV